MGTTGPAAVMPGVAQPGLNPTAQQPAMPQRPATPMPVQQVGTPSAPVGAGLQRPQEMHPLARALMGVR